MNEEDQIEYILEKMDNGHLFRRYVERHLAKDFLYSLVNGLVKSKESK